MVVTDCVAAIVLADLSVPEICQKFAAQCAGNVPKEFTASLQHTVCQKTNKFAANSCGKFAAYLQQT